jgi:hypothetical protein
MTRFSQIPTDKFPLNADAYDRLWREFGSIAKGFSNLGTADGSAVAKKIDKVQAALGDSWELIQETERRERVS